MALLVVLLLALGAAADEYPVQWSTGKTTLTCVVPGADRLNLRRPPQQLASLDHHQKPKLYTWYHNGVEIPPKRILANGSIEVSKKRGNGEGLYQCSVKHAGGVILGYPINLKFATIDRMFSEHPQNQTGFIGQPVVLTCDIHSSPPAVISWTRDKVKLPENPRYFKLDNQLLITDLDKTDEGVYRCIAKNEYLNKTRYSNKGKLQVEEATEDPEYSFLPLNYGGNLTVVRGSRTVLPCPFEGPKTEMVWERTPKEGPTEELESTEQVLVIPMIQLDGVYTCSIEGRRDLSKQFSITLQEGAPKPVRIVLPPISKSAVRASTVRFNCTAEGNPTPEVTWYLNGEEVDLAGRVNIRKLLNGDRKELVISGVSSADAGIYQCIARSPVSVSSRWALLAVAGAAGPSPRGLRCAPHNATAVALRWTYPGAPVVAFTIHAVNLDKPKPERSVPVRELNGTMVVEELAPYKFQVRAYGKGGVGANTVSELSEPVVCQGQGVPIILYKLNDTRIQVTWKDFAEQTSGVLQWRLEYKTANETKSIDLDASVTNYTLDASPPPILVRVLGTKVLPWLPQDLALVGWHHATHAATKPQHGEVLKPPTDIEVVEANDSNLTLRWRYEPTTLPLTSYHFIVCAKKKYLPEQCLDSPTTSATLEGLEADSEYAIRIQARKVKQALGGPFTQPYVAKTKTGDSQLIKNLTYRFLNKTAVLVSWEGSEQTNYTVHYSLELTLPVDNWSSMNVVGTSVVLRTKPSGWTFVMVTAGEGSKNNKILTIREQEPEDESKDIKIEYTSDGVVVRWPGQDGRYLVRYSQELTANIEKWTEVEVNEPRAELHNLNNSLQTYLLISSSGRDKVYTIPAAPPSFFYFYIGIGAACGLLFLCIICIISICFWRKRKRLRSPLSSRRRNTSFCVNEDDEGSEMKNVGGRLANGGVSRDVGEPLLNGQVHIIENPTLSKPPNGRTKKPPNYEAAFDVSRQDFDTTLETVLNDTPQYNLLDTTHYNLLDTSRRPEYETNRISANNSYNKLPDDNMNSEMNNSDFVQDNSNLKPTLQPNG